MRNFTKRQLGRTICFLVLFLFLAHLFTPTYKEKIYLPLPKHRLKRLTGEEVELSQSYINKPLLILFFSDRSPTSREQVMAVVSLLDDFPSEFRLLFIHCGEPTGSINVQPHPQLELLIDANAELCQKMGIYIIPSLFILTVEREEAFFSWKFVGREELLQAIGSIL